ncbi:MAG: hemerythrin family protein [Planctomycetota bacterium]|jgi:hemerythrin|nr:hemerythrin family protein [Planctomycetota bacterium]
MHNGIAWDDSYLIGCDEVDEQHKQLFASLNELVEHCQKGSAAQVVGKTLQFVAEYVEHHFNSEEKVQVSSNYPGYAAHKQMHDDFRKTVGVIKGQFAENGSVQDLQKILVKVVVKWIVTHICNEDKKIGAYLKTIP